MAAEDTRTYNDQLQRIMLVTGKHSLTTLAEELGVGMPAMTDARRRGKIPADWLLTLTMKKGVNPEWLLTGQGPCFVSGLSAPGARYLDDKEVAEMEADRRALQRLSSRMLAEELLRRIVRAQAESFIRRT